MVRMFSSLPIAMRLWSMVVLSLIGFAIAFTGEMREMSSNTYAGRQAKVKNVVQAAHSILGHFAHLAETGVMSREQAQTAAKNAIAAIRYDEREYLWLNDLSGIMVMHPTNPDLDGKALFQLKDANGKFFFKEMVDIVLAKGEGELGYLWPKAGSTHAEPKLSYVKGFAPWNWMVGSGVYVDDVETAIRERGLERGIQTALGIVALMASCWFIGRSITRPLKRLTAAMHGLA
ncbi:MAG: cache domain-containing protein, partial [Magnetospirillum sp.]|nr:cache domain-containing protein [Magnetospirillum sp.]